MTHRRSGATSLDVGPFLWGMRLDLSIFGGSAALGLAIAAVASVLHLEDLPESGWLLLVLGVDVAHVHTTWFRTYFDGAELRRHPWRYLLVPILAYALGFLAFQRGSIAFWRVIAYLAVFHFIRQQVGWVALYRARRGGASPWERFTDDFAVYAATFVPILYWHEHAQEKSIAWFMRGDFIDLSGTDRTAMLWWIWGLALGLFFGRAGVIAWRQRRLELGKLCVVLTTAVCWFVGIVATDSDTVFTATNVLPHGIPYIWLLHRYSRARRSELAGRGSAELGFPRTWQGLWSIAFCCAYVEEIGWHRFVDLDRAWLFGSGQPVSSVTLAFLVPLLAIPQLSHYLLDGVIWRRGDSRGRPAQRQAIGLP